MNREKHIDWPVLSRRTVKGHGRRYAMHPRRSHLAPEVVAAYLDWYTEEGDVVLDPFCGSGVVAAEALRLGRRVIAIDSDPLATLITRATLAPVSLFRLDWAFQDVQKACEPAIAELYETRCTQCGRPAVAELVRREDDDPGQIRYSCRCSGKRLLKDADRRDARLERSLEKRPVPFPYPENVSLPREGKQPHRFVHELFTRRVLICLATLLDAVRKVEGRTCRDLLEVAFAAALEECRRPRPSRASREVNPWKAFYGAFRNVYQAKKQSGARLRNVVIAEKATSFFSGKASALILSGPAEKNIDGRIPPGSVDYLLTDPPYDAPAESAVPPAVARAWLGLDFDGDGAIASSRSEAARDCRRRAADAIRAAARALKDDACAHFFFHDVPGSAFHALLRALPPLGYTPRKVVYQPPSKGPGPAAANSREYAGGYIVRAGLANGATPLRISRHKLRRTVAGLVRTTLEIRGGEATLGSVWHAVYQGLGREAIEALAEQDPRDFLKAAVADFARIKGRQLTLLNPHEAEAQADRLRDQITGALLDAYAMLAERPDAADRAWQLVFRRFEGKPVTFDDVRALDRQITREQRIEHRRKRYRQLLRRAGKVLGFQPRRRETDANRLTWQKDGKVVCQFGGLGSPEITVRVPHAGGTLRRAREWGVLEYEDLEQVLWNWAQNDASVRRAVGRRLNPMALCRRQSDPVEHPGVAGAAVVQWRVLSNEEVCPDHRVMELEVGEKFAGRLEPGQFFHVLCGQAGISDGRGSPKDAGQELTLRRPLSAHRFHYVGFDRTILAQPSPLPPELRDKVKRRVSQLDFLYRVVGAGTRRLARLEQGDFLDVLGPIGRGFSTGAQRRAVIVAGGVGIAPLAALAEWLRYLDVKLRVYLGALKEEHLWMAVRRPDAAVYRGSPADRRKFARLIQDEFAEIGVEKVVVCTDDGSVGRKGRVTDVLARDIEAGRLWRKDVRFYACGPTPMMAAASKIATRLGAPCEVLLEERMGCGVGACYSCVCKIRDDGGNVKTKRVCVDGPVFDGAQVSWQS